MSNVSNGNSTSTFPLPIAFLLSDTNGDGRLNTADALETRSRSGTSVDAGTFRSDLNADGAINAADSAIVRSNSGASLP